LGQAHAAFFIAERELVAGLDDGTTGQNLEDAHAVFLLVALHFSAREQSGEQLVGTRLLLFIS